MRRIAAIAGSLLMLSASWSAAAGGIPLAAAPSTSASPDSTTTGTRPPLNYGNPPLPRPALPHPNPANPPPLGPDAIPQSVPSDNSLFSSLPDLGGPAYARLSRDDEDQIGHMVVNQIRNAHLLLGDPDVDEYLQNLGMRLASQAHDEGQSFHYYCMDDSQINSFATFGGNVFIFTGLMLLTQNEGELAAVMAHETGHVVQRHIAREIEAESHLSIASTAAMLAAVLIGVAAGGGNSGEAMEGALAMAQATAMQRSINFTRSQESEADAVGIRLLAAAGFDPYDMANMFERMQDLSGSEVPALLIDHPVIPARIAEARARAAQLPRLSGYPDSLAYAFIKERVRVLSSPTLAAAAQYYAGLRARRPLSAAERYGNALVQIQQGQGAAAVLALRDLRAQYPELILLYSALGQALQAAGHSDAALAEFAQSEQLFPRNVPLSIHYAETLMKAGRPAAAHQLLNDLFNVVEPTPPQIQLTAMAASAAGDTGDAYYYMGEYNLANGQLSLADQELELALRTPDLTHIQRARFLARLEQVRGWIREQQQERH